MSMRLTTDSTVLVVMDVQERLVAAMPEEVRGEAIDNIIRLVQGARILGVPVIATEQYPVGLGPTVAPLAHALAESGASTPIAKNDFDACSDPGFASALEERLAGRALAECTVLVCGMETHICIYQTARTLVARGQRVQVPYDATCSRKPEPHAIARGLIEKVGATITCTEAVLFDLLGRSGGDEFKAISKLVR